MAKHKTYLSDDEADGETVADPGESKGFTAAQAEEAAQKSEQAACDRFERRYKQAVGQIAQATKTLKDAGFGNEASAVAMSLYDSCKAAHK